MNKKKVVLLILAILFAMMVGIPMAFAFGGGGHAGGHASGHSSGHAGEAGGHESFGSHGEGEGEGGHSTTAGRVLIVSHGTVTDSTCAHGVDYTQDITASETRVVCKEQDNTDRALIILFFLAFVAVILAPLLPD